MNRPPAARGRAGPPAPLLLLGLLGCALLRPARAEVKYCDVYADEAQEQTCLHCVEGTTLVNNTCLPDESCRGIEGCGRCEDWNSPLCGDCEADYVLVKDVGLCLREGFCVSDATGCTECSTSDPRICITCKDGYSPTQGGTMCIPPAMSNDRYCIEADADDPEACASCSGGRVPQNGACVLLDALTEMTGCYANEAIMDLDYFNGRACLSVSPTNAKGCEPLAANSGVHLVFEASALIDPLEADIPDFSYLTSTSLCVNCPDSDFELCKARLSASNAGTVEIQTFSHFTVIPVTKMNTQISNFSNCFSHPASIYVKKDSYEVCAEAETTSRCSSLRYIDVREFSMTLMSDGENYTYDFDPTIWSPYSSMFCAKCSDDEGKPTACYEFAEAAELYPWITGSALIRGFIDEQPMSIKIDLPYMVNDYQADCFESITVVLFRNKLDLTLNPSNSSSAHCDTDKSVRNTRFTIAVYAEGVRYPLEMEYTRAVVNLRETTLVRFYYEKKHMEAVEGLLSTPLSLMSEVIIEHLNRRGDTVATTRRKATSVQAGSYDNVCAYYYADKVCFRIFPLLSPNGVVASDLSSDVSAEAILQLSTDDPLVVEDLVNFTADGHFERKVSNICFPCSSVTSLARGYTCQSALARAAKDLTKSVSSIRLYFHATSTQGNWLLATTHYRKNYATVYIVGSCVAVALLLPSVIHVAMLFKGVRVERAKLKKLLRRARKARNA